MPSFSHAVVIDTAAIHEYSGTISPLQEVTLPPLSALVAVFGGASTNVKEQGSKTKLKFTLGAAQK
ncbi:MAG: hypothetical protein ONB42_24160 [candidate division KSB1 bacterium]|nr:hypothetical protein [candidate division KSB1 bacterium]